MASAPTAGRNGGNGSKKDRDENVEARIENYKKRAEELRAISATLKTPGARETVLQIALEYDHMADALRKLAH